MTHRSAESTDWTQSPPLTLFSRSNQSSRFHSTRPILRTLIRLMTSAKPSASWSDEVTAARIPRPATISSHVLSGYFRTVARSVTVSLYVPTETGLHGIDQCQLREVLGDALVRGPLMLPFWNAHSMLLLTS